MVGATHNGDDDGINKVKVKPFRFFKIVLPAILLRNSLRIPDKFANKFGPRLSSGAVLTIPSGLSWNVDLTRLDGKLHFTGQGWVNFMEQNHILYGYFLEFVYQGNSHFTVYIFDLSCTEIDYPVEFDHHRNGNGNGNGKQQSPLYHEEHVKANGRQVEKDESTNIIHSADTLSSGSKCDIPCFTITVRRCHVTSNAYLHIPKRFTNEYMEGKLYKFVKLVVDDGREWDLHLYYTAADIRFYGPRWRKFEQENNWKEGEVYTFALVNKKPKLLVFKVSKQ